MRTSLLCLFFACAIFSAKAQITKAEQYAVGTKITTYLGECGNTIPEAAGKLSYCDRAGNLLVVEKSVGLNARGVLRMIPNFFNNDELYITRNGLSIRQENGSWDNVPNQAILRVNTNGIPINEATIQSGVRIQDGRILLSASNSFNLNIYDPVSKTLSEIDLPEFQVVRQLVYDATNNETWIIAQQSSAQSFLLKYDGTSLVPQVQLTGSLGSAALTINAASLSFYNNELFLGTTTGLYRIPTANPNAYQFYNSTTTPAIPMDRVYQVDTDALGNLWFTQNNTNNGTIVKLDLDTETFEEYPIENPNLPGFNLKLQHFAFETNEFLHVYASNHSGRLTLDVSADSPVWELYDSSTFEDNGVPITYTPNRIYNQDGKIYFITNDFSTGNSLNYEVVIKEGDQWSGRNDNAPGNYSYWMLERFEHIFPADNGEMWFFNPADRAIVNYQGNDEFTADFNLNFGYLTPAVDTDHKLVLKTSIPSQISKVDFPVIYPLSASDGNGSDVLQRYKDQIWAFNRSEETIDVYKNNVQIQTYELQDPDYSSFFYFDVRDDGMAIFARTIGGGVELKAYDPADQSTETTFIDQNISTLRDVLAGPDNTIWIVARTGVIFYDGTTFTTLLGADYPELSNTDDAVVDANGILHIAKGFVGTTVTIENPTDATPTITETVLDGNAGLLPTINFYGSSTIALDNDGSRWIDAGNSTSLVKLTDDNTAKQYKTEGESYTLSGRVFKDSNENNVYDEGEEVPHYAVAIKVNDIVFKTFTAADGTYEYLLNAANTTYEVFLPVLGTYDSAAIRHLNVAVTSTEQNYTDNDFKIDPKFGNTIFVQSASKSGAWGFERDGFENTFTTVLTNVSANQIYYDLLFEYVFYNEEENTGHVFPQVEEVVVTKLVPTGNFYMAEHIDINPRSHQWSTRINPNTYTQSNLDVVPSVISQSDTLSVGVTIPQFQPGETYVVEVKLELFDPTQTNVKIIHGPSKVASDDITNTPNNDGVVILMPEENRDFNYFPLPLEDPNSPYIDPEDIYSDPPYVDPSEVYAPRPGRTKIRSSFDPNDKLVYGGFKDQINDTNIENKWLTYTVQFENTGNFSAKDIYILDDLDANIDVNSIRLIESSHAVTLDFVPLDENITTLRFSFNDIYLPFEEGQNTGHVTFVAKALSDINEETIVENTAAIYFDQNPPIITNTVQNRFITIEELAVNDVLVDHPLAIYPNPASTAINIETNAIVERVEFFSVQGAKVMETNSHQNIDVSGLSNGIYLIRIKSSAGVQSRKIIIQ